MMHDNQNYHAFERENVNAPQAMAPPNAAAAAYQTAPDPASPYRPYNNYHIPPTSRGYNATQDPVSVFNPIVGMQANQEMRTNPAAPDNVDMNATTGYEQYQNSSPYCATPDERDNGMNPSLVASMNYYYYNGASEPPMYETHPHPQAGSGGMYDPVSHSSTVYAHYDPMQVPYVTSTAAGEQPPYYNPHYSQNQPMYQESDYSSAIASHPYDSVQPPFYEHHSYPLMENFNTTVQDAPPLSANHNLEESPLNDSALPVEQEGWNDADLEITNQLQGLNVGNSDDIQPNQNEPSTDAPLSVTREKDNYEEGWTVESVLEDPVLEDSRRPPTIVSDMLMPLREDEHPSVVFAKRPTQLSEGSDGVSRDNNTMEIYWKETRQWGEESSSVNDEGMKTLAKLNPEVPSYAESMAKEDLGQYSAAYKRQDSTWAGPAEESAVIKPEVGEVIKNETTKKTEIWPAKNVVPVTTTTTTMDVDHAEDGNASFSESYRFRKAVGAERHRPDIVDNEHLYSSATVAPSVKEALMVSVSKPSASSNRINATSSMKNSDVSVAASVRSPITDENRTISAFQSMPGSSNTGRIRQQLPSQYYTDTPDSTRHNPVGNSRNRTGPYAPHIMQGSASFADRYGGGGGGAAASSSSNTQAILGRYLPGGTSVEMSSNSKFPTTVSSRRAAGGPSASGRVTSPNNMANHPWRQPSGGQQQRTVTGHSNRNRVNEDPLAQGFYQNAPLQAPQVAATATSSHYPWRPNRTEETNLSIAGGSEYGGNRCGSRASLSSEGYPYSARKLDGMPAEEMQRLMWEQYMQSAAAGMNYGYMAQAMPQPMTQTPAYLPGSGGNYDPAASMASMFYDQTMRQWDQFFQQLSSQSGISTEQRQSAENAFRTAIQSYADFYERYYSMVNPKPGRLTPKLYSTPHRIANIAQPGLMLQVLPHRPDEGQPAVVELQSLPSWEGDRCAHNSFPGPLTRDGTLKGEVRAYLRSRLADLRHEMPSQWDSMCLMLNYLDSLVQENGHMEQNELAKLLMEGHEPRTEDLRPSGHLLSSALNSHLDDDNRFASLPPSEPPSGRGSPQGGGGAIYNLSRPQSRAASVLSAAADQLLRSQALARQTRGAAGGLAVTGLSHLSMEQADRHLDQYRLLVMRNEKLQALEYACKHSLWGCAFSLASQLPNAAKILPKVLSRFLSRAIQPSDPLQTLHHLLANQVPAFLRNGLTGPGANADWSDWRPHLAMILSAYAQQPQLSLQCMNHMGDNLGAARILFASQLCYLFAETAFRTGHEQQAVQVCSQSANKITLLGADFHRRAIRQWSEEWQSNADNPNEALPHPKLSIEQWEHFDPLLSKLATDEAIQLTEIYEYACSLKQKDFYLPHLVPFKLIYAIRLLDAGFVERAFRYCKVISIPLRRQPHLYPRRLFFQVLKLAERLQFHPECTPVDNFDDDHFAAASFNTPQSSNGDPSGMWIRSLRVIYESSLRGQQSQPSAVPSVLEYPQPSEPQLPAPPSYSSAVPGNNFTSSKSGVGDVDVQDNSSAAIKTSYMNPTTPRQPTPQQPAPPQALPSRQMDVMMSDYSAAATAHNAPVFGNNQFQQRSHQLDSSYQEEASGYSTGYPIPPSSPTVRQQPAVVAAAPQPPQQMPQPTMPEKYEPSPPAYSNQQQENRLQHKQEPMEQLNLSMPQYPVVGDVQKGMPGKQESFVKPPGGGVGGGSGGSRHIHEEPPRDSPIPFVDVKASSMNIFVPTASTMSDSSGPALSSEESMYGQTMPSYPAADYSASGFDYFAMASSMQSTPRPRSFSTQSASSVRGHAYQSNLQPIDNEEALSTAPKESSPTYATHPPMHQQPPSVSSSHDRSTAHPMLNTSSAPSHPMSSSTMMTKPHSPEEQMKSQSSSATSKAAKRNDQDAGSEKAKNPGIFGRIFGRKNNNEVYLPDDSKQTIKYDKDKNRWIDSSAPEEDDTAAAGPPPKPMTQMAQQPPNSVGIGGNNSGLGTRSRYVSIGAVTGNRIAPPGTAGTDAPPGFMRPPMPSIPAPPMMMQQSPLTAAHTGGGGGMFMPRLGEEDSPGSP